MDDDVYVNVKELIRILNIFKDSQPVYFGRSGTTPEAPRTVLKGQCSYIIRSAHVSILLGHCMEQSLSTSDMGWFLVYFCRSTGMTLLLEECTVSIEQC